MKVYHIRGILVGCIPIADSVVHHSLNLGSNSQ